MGVARRVLRQKVEGVLQILIIINGAQDLDQSKGKISEK